jgi:hypothetical protein
VSYMTSEQWEAPANALKKLDAPSKLAPLPRTSSWMDVMGNKRKNEKKCGTSSNLDCYT